jgi:hypothetical protein
VQKVQFQHKTLTAAEVRSNHMHRLHRVKLFSAALCHITQGSKVIIQEENRVVATPDELIIIPANTALEIINQPVQASFVPIYYCYRQICSQNLKRNMYAIFLLPGVRLRTSE